MEQSFRRYAVAFGSGISSHRVQAPTCIYESLFSIRNDWQQRLFGVSSPFVLVYLIDLVCIRVLFYHSLAVLIPSWKSGHKYSVRIL